MKRTILGAVIIMVGVSLALAQKITRTSQANDEEALKQLVIDWADAVSHYSPKSASRLDRFSDESFKGSAEGISFNKRMLAEALRSGQMKVGSWDCDRSQLKVTVRGNSAIVTGHCELSKASYMGRDFSGGWDFTDHFVKQKDGSWRAVSSQAKRNR